MESRENLTAGFSGGLNLPENKKLRVEKALLSLLVEWRNLEEHIDPSTQQSLEACLTDIQSRQERLSSVQESVTESNRVLDELRRSLEQRSEEIDRRDNDVREFYEEKRKELGARENKLNFCRRFVEKSVKDLDVREKEIEEKKKVIEELFEKFNLEKSEFEKIRAFVDGRFEEMESKERAIQELHEKLNLKRSELERIEIFVEESFKEMQMKKKSIENHENEVSTKMKNVLEKEKEIKLKEMELVSIRNLNEQKRKEVEGMEESTILKEKNLDMVRKSTQTSYREFDSQKENLDLEKKLVDERIKELELKEKYFKEWVEAIDLKEKEIESKNVSNEERCRELEDKEKKFDERLKEFELKEKHLKEWIKTIDLKEKDIDLMRIMNEECVKAIALKEKEIESKRIMNDERSKKFESKEKCLHDMLTEFKLKEQQFELCVGSFEAKVKEVNSIRISCEERCRKFELEKKSLKDKLKEFELKKQSSNVDYSIVKTEPSSIDSSYADIRFSVTMDGKNLLLYLIDRKRDLDSMTDEVFKALSLSKDPAKLVLDAMQGFYMKKEDKDFEVDVVCRSTVLLLEQLRRISSPIQSCSQEAALELAREWKVKMKNLQEVIVFFQLLASYRLGSAFEPGEFLSIFEVIGQQKQTLELCQLLGYSDKISDLVQVLLNKQQHILAVRYVCAFGLLDKYKPASLLNDFCKNAEEASETFRNDGNMSVNAKEEFIDNIVASLREAAVCISNHKIESDFSPQSFETFIALLTGQKEDHKVVLSASDNNAEKKQLAGRNCKSAMNVVNPTQLDHETNNNQEAPGPVLDTKNAMAVILRHMSGKCLQLFLNENAQDHELIINDVANALRISRDSPKFVLKSIQGFYPPHIETGDKKYTSPVVMRSCILLLEQLMKLSPKIKIQVKKDALKLAFDWRAKMRSPLQILGFLHIITAYGLNSSFELSELSTLFESVSYLKHDPQLCRAFLFSDNSSYQTMTSSRICNWHHKNSLGPQMNIKVNHNVNKGTSIQAADEAKLVLDAMRGCCYSDLNVFMRLSPILVKNFVVLLEKLLRMSPQIQPHVKEDAAKFAIDWKARLVKNKARNPVEVFALLHLLAVYKVVSSVDSSELLDLFNNIYQQRNAPDLVRLLGLAHIIPKFIESLVQKLDRLQAIRYIYEFKLVEKFPPVPILKDHLSSMKGLAANIHPKEMDHFAIVKAIGKPLHALRGAVKYIRDYQLEVECPLEDVLAQIQQLEELAKENTERGEQLEKFQTNQNAVGPEEKIKRPESHKKFTEKPNAAVPEGNIERAESCKKVRHRKRRRAAGLDKSQMHWHIRKHSRTEPLAETCLNICDNY